MIAVLDFEATGVDPLEARAVSAALVLCTADGHTLPGGVHHIIDPGVPIPAEAAAIHGITDDVARELGRSPVDVFADLVRCLRGIAALGWPLAIYNAPYDWPLLHAECGRVGIAQSEIPELRLLDPLVLDRGYDRFRKGSRKLEDTCRHYGVVLSTSHDAFADASATSSLVRQVVRRYPELQQMTFQDLHAVQRDMHRAWVESFNAYRARRGQDPIPDTPWPGAALPGEASAWAGPPPPLTLL